MEESISISTRDVVSTASVPKSSDGMDVDATLLETTASDGETSTRDLGNPTDSSG
jgi:hypothetical protein